MVTITRMFNKTNHTGDGKNISPTSFTSSRDGNIRVAFSPQTANTVLTLVSNGNGKIYTNAETVTFTGAVSGATGTGTAVVTNNLLTGVSSATAGASQQFVINETLIFIGGTSTANTGTGVVTVPNVLPLFTMTVTATDDVDARTEVGLFAVANSFHNLLIPARAGKDYNFSTVAANVLNSIFVNYES